MRAIIRRDNFNVFREKLTSVGNGTDKRHEGDLIGNQRKKERQKKKKNATRAALLCLRNGERLYAFLTFACSRRDATHDSERNKKSGDGRVNIAECAAYLSRSSSLAALYAKLHLVKTRITLR